MLSNLKVSASCKLAVLFAVSLYIHSIWMHSVATEYERGKPKDEWLGVLTTLAVFWFTKVLLQKFTSAELTSKEKMQKNW